MRVLAYYQATGIALALLVVVAAWSHARRTAAVRTSSLFLPTFVAGIEACRHFTWSLRCRGLGAKAPTLGELHGEFHMTSLASLGVVAATVAVALLLFRFCRRGVAERISARASLPPLAVLAAVALLWIAADRLFFGLAAT